MTSPEPDFDALVDALRSDLPNDADERRVRARLLGAGVALTAAAIAPTATAAGMASGSSAPIALLHKFGALSWLTKVGIAGVTATAVVPVAINWSNPEAGNGSPVTAPATPRITARHASQQPKAKQPAAAELAVLPTPAAAPAAKTEREGAGLEAAPASEPPAPEAHAAPVSASGPGPVAAFPVEETKGPRPLGTLGEETELVERALYALKLGDREGARRTLAEHARRFPNGLLARERERALVRAAAADDPSGSASP
jgi:hypothetical protein